MSKEQIGIVAVDAGILMVGDPCYHVHYHQTPKAFGTSWEDFCLNILRKGGTTLNNVQLNFDDGYKGLGVICGGFGGDGCFPVYVKRNDSGRVTKLVVDFE